jgi:peptidoglycan/xylan/chitin deacetylase (PgdA/CDA1 family)
MSRNAKRAVLFAAKWTGLFYLARLLTRRHLRILCYHAFAFEDESIFRGKLFMRPETFNGRLQFLVQKGFPVLRLAEALARLEGGSLPAGATVITIDDGFFSVYRLAAPLLERFQFPATIYVYTYYCDLPVPVFRLCVQYMFWKTKVEQLDMRPLGIGRLDVVSLSDPRVRSDVLWEIVCFGEEKMNEEGRQQICQRLSEALRVDYDHILSARLMSVMNREELRELASRGFDLQLHTHHHVFPEEEAAALREIEENRAVLEPLSPNPAVHFCYPSGMWSARQFPWLVAAGVRSATTCQAGLNTRSTPRFALFRFLDGEDISHIEFEAEIYGFAEALRVVRRIFRRPLPARESEASVLPYGAPGDLWPETRKHRS